MAFTGIVKDKLRTLKTRRTKAYDTYQDAHKAAEKLCKSSMGDRGIIEVEQSK